MNEKILEIIRSYFNNADLVLNSFNIDKDCWGIEEITLEFKQKKEEK